MDEWMDGASRSLLGHLCVCVHATLPGAGLTSTRLLPAESCSPSRQWPADSIGGQMAAAAAGLRSNWTDFHLTFDLRAHRSWFNSISPPGCEWLMRGGGGGSSRIAAV